MSNTKEICPFPKIYPSLLNRDDSYYMKLAYNNAIEAWESDEVPIGAVIIYRDQVIASAFNQVEKTKDPTAHAEMLAITQAANLIGDWRLNEATLYVTKEPCPMCSGACIMSRLERVVYAFKDPKMGCLGGNLSMECIDTFNHKLIITTGILEGECKQLVQAFFSEKRKET